MKGAGRRRSGSGAALALVVLLASGLPRDGRAQSHPAQLVPFGGMAVPQGRIYTYKSAAISHQNAVAFGGRFDAWLTRTLGVELVASYAPSGYHVVDSTGAAHDTTGGLFTASGRVLYRFVRAGPFAAHVLAGGGILTHSGRFTERLSGRSDPAGVVGVSAGVAVSQWMLVVAAEEYLYPAALGGIGGYPDAPSRLNGLFVLSLGAEVPLGAWLPNDLRRRR